MDVAVRHQFSGGHSQGGNRIQIDLQGYCRACLMHISMLGAMDLGEVGAKLAHIRAKIDGICQPTAKQTVIHPRHRHEPECDRLDALLRRTVVQRRCVSIQHRQDKLQIVSKPMLEFPCKNIVLVNQPPQGLHPRLVATASASTLAKPVKKLMSC